MKRWQPRRWCKYGRRRRMETGCRDALEYEMHFGAFRAMRKELKSMRQDPEKAKIIAMMAQADR